MNEIDLSASVESLVSQVTDEFIERLDRGEQPEIEEFAVRYPRIGTVLRQVLPALRALRLPIPEPVQSASPTTSEQPSTRCLGDFRILREIGRGGMGVVYEAEQRSLARKVALKVLPFAVTIDGKQLQRFMNEAQAAARLHHQNIVPVYAVGCERGVHYYAMQFIEGQSVEDLIHELRQWDDQTRVDRRHLPGPLSAITCDLLDGTWAPATRPPETPHEATAPSPLPPGPVGRSAATTSPGLRSMSTERSIQTLSYWRTVANLGVQAAKALEHAHNLGIVHRDIKPGNLLVDVRGNLWITDFGLAHCQSQVGLTMTGDLVGTLRYMSPEQALAQRGIIDHRTDLFSLGVTLYELLTLEPAFVGCDRQELLRQIAHEEPRSPRLLNKSIPVDLETIVLKAMAKNPVERYATAEDLAEDLERLLRDEPIRARRPTLLHRLRKWARRRQSVMWSVAVCLLLGVTMVTGSVGWIVRDRAAREAATEREASLTLAEAAKLRAEGNWTEAQKAAKRGADLLTAGSNSQLLAQAQELRQDLEMVLRLEAIRLPQVDAITEGAVDDRQLDADYDAAFRDYGLDLKALEVSEAAQRVGARAIRLELVTALDHWAKVRSTLLGRARAQDDKLRQRLIAVARAADPDEWRNQVRDALQKLDARELRNLASSPKIGCLPLVTLSLLGWALDILSCREAVTVLRLAQQKYPDDYEINFQLAWSLDHVPGADPHPLDDAVRFYTVARALRPQNVRVHVVLADKLCQQGKLDEAVGVYRRALVLNPDRWQTHQNLGAVLRDQDRLEEAIAEFQQVQALKADAVWPYVSIGLISRRLGKLDEAIAEWRRALELDSKFAEAHFLLASALREQGEFAEALRYARSSQELSRDLTSKSGWCYPTADLVQVVDQLVRLSPQLSRVLSGAQPIADQAERLAYAELCFQQRQFERAAGFYEEALAKQPDLAASLGTGHWYNAARSAALAGTGAGKEAASLTDGQRGQRRRQGRDWLRAALQQHTQALSRGDLRIRSITVQSLRQWLRDRNWKGLRDEEFLAELSIQEREAWVALWQDVRMLTRKEN
jgi:serine/threonine protein kinase